jgi:hypothetical protein
MRAAGAEGSVVSLPSRHPLHSTVCVILKGRVLRKLPLPLARIVTRIQLGHVSKLLLHKLDKWMCSEQVLV